MQLYCRFSYSITRCETYLTWPDGPSADCSLISGWMSVVLISRLEVALAVLVTNYLASNPSSYASHHDHCSWPTCPLANFGGLSCVDIDTYVGSWLPFIEHPSLHCTLDFL